MSEEHEIVEQLSTNNDGNEASKTKSFISRFLENLKDEDFWKETIRPRALEVLTALSFLGGVTLTALIASGVLLWGPIGLGICATLGFIGASHLFGTASWLSVYYNDNNGHPWFKDAGAGWNFFAAIIKFIVLPIIFALGGISLVVLGSLGIMELGLGLGLGIPSIVASLFAFNCFTFYPDQFGNNEGFARGVWSAFIAVAGMIAAATFLVLGFAGILAWSSVLAFGVPAAIAAIVIPIVGIAINSTNWIYFRTRVEELLEPVLFCGGIALTVLISLGILPFGAVGIGICSMLTFFSASRFLTTNSWSKDHNYQYNQEKNSLIDDKKYVETRLTKLIFSLVGTIAGIALLALGAVGVFGFGLGFAVGMPILAPSICGVIKEFLLHKYDDNERSKLTDTEQVKYEYKYKIHTSDNVWSVSTAISGAITAGVSLGLGFGGILALPVAIAIAVPLTAFSALIGLVHLALFGLSKTGQDSFEFLKKPLLDDNDKLSLLGIGFYKVKYCVKVNSSIDLRNFM